MKKGAVLDKAGLYRYSLFREWNMNDPKVVFIMLNPSKADADIDDPMLRRCINFAKSWSCYQNTIFNLTV